MYVLMSRFHAPILIQDRNKSVMSRIFVQILNHLVFKEMNDVNHLSLKERIKKHTNKKKSIYCIYSFFEHGI